MEQTIWKPAQGVAHAQLNDLLRRGPEVQPISPSLSISLGLYDYLHGQLEWDLYQVVNV